MSWKSHRVDITMRQYLVEGHPGGPNELLILDVTARALAMDAKKLKKLKAIGGKVTTVQDFLDLSNEDMAVIEARLALAKAIREQIETQGRAKRAVHTARAEWVRAAR